MKKRKISIEDYDSELDVSFSKREVIKRQFPFRPPHLIAKLVEAKTTTKMLSSAIILLLGVGINDFTVTIVEDGTYSVLSVLWPEPKQLLQKWLPVDAAEDRIQPYHPDFIAFESFLKDLRENVSVTIRSVCSVSCMVYICSSITVSFL